MLEEWLDLCWACLLQLLLRLLIQGLFIKLSSCKAFDFKILNKNSFINDNLIFVLHPGLSISLEFSQAGGDNCCK